jgi:dienelactone hydrolase
MSTLNGRRRPVLLLVAVIVAVGLVAGGLLLYRANDDTGKTPGIDPNAGEHGDAISSSALRDVKTGAASAPVASRIVYRSTNGDTGKRTIVSGAFFVPRGTAPHGGWPVIAVAHSTVGISEECAPSLSPTLAGQADLVARFLNLGYAVALPDFQGLGEPGIHPYLDARTAGRNLIDAVLAFRATVHDLSSDWGAFGGSQGGGAAWSANEQAASYGPGLHLVGTAAIAPAADVTGLVDEAVAGTLTADQRPGVQWIVETLARLHPDELDRDDYRHGTAVKDWDVLSSCSPKLAVERTRAIERLGPLDLTPVSEEAADKLRFLLRAWSLPQGKLSAPLVVAYGGKDEFIDPHWTDGALVRQCALGGQVLRVFLPDNGHADIDYSLAITWLQGRFAGKPVQNQCPKD